jgi:hypothetical protein
MLPKKDEAKRYQCVNQNSNNKTINMANVQARLNELQQKINDENYKKSQMQSLPMDIDQRLINA